MRNARVNGQVDARNVSDLSGNKRAPLLFVENGSLHASLQLLVSPYVGNFLMDSKVDSDSEPNCGTNHLPADFEGSWCTGTRFKMGGRGQEGGRFERDHRWDRGACRPDAGARTHVSFHTVITQIPTALGETQARNSLSSVDRATTLISWSLKLQSVLEGSRNLLWKTHRKLRTR